jgi:hypothetical protein
MMTKILSQMILFTVILLPMCKVILLMSLLLTKELHTRISVTLKLIDQFVLMLVQGDGAGKDVLTGLSNGMDRHKSKDKV